jgi:hypothetical protein
VLEKGRTAAASLLAAALFAAGASPAAGQSAIYGAGLQAWLGCWSAELSAARTDAAPTIVCITPTASVDVADVITMQDGKIVGRETLDATGRPRAIDAARCTGLRSAHWSRDARRLFVGSNGSCAGVASATSGLLAISAEGDWLDVEGISAGGGASVRVARYREVTPPIGLPAAARSALRAQTLATRSMRAAAGAPVRAEDVLEASRALDPAVVDAWILERAQHFDITQTDLAALVNLGVPARIVDALGVVADPQAYELARGSDDAPNAEHMPSYADSYDLPLGWGWGWGYALPIGTRFGTRFGGTGFRNTHRFGFYRPPIVIARGHDGRPRGRGEAGQGGYPRGGGRTGTGRDGRTGGQPPSSTTRPPAGDPRRATPQSEPAGDPRHAPPSGGTVRLGRP